MKINLTDKEIKYLKLTIGQELFLENIVSANGCNLFELYKKLAANVKDN